MGMVTNVYWDCPGCGSKQLAQAYGEFDDYDFANENSTPVFHPHFVPVDRGLKWNPPCTECGKFQLLPESKWTKYIPQPATPQGNHD